MQHKLIIIASIGVVVTALAGCATYKTTLTDAQGRTVTCEASGKNGIITGQMLRSTFEQCVADAKANGFREGYPPRVATPESGSPSASDGPSNPAPSSPADLQAKLLTLKQVYEQGLISEQEYEAKKKSLLKGF